MMRRALLLLLLGVVALNALGGAWYGLAGARDVPREWLEGSPFDSYLVPSLYLGIVIGGSHLAAFALVLVQHRHARGAAAIAAALLASWIVAQVAMIGYVSFLQPAMFATACVVLALAATSRRVVSRTAVQ